MVGDFWAKNTVLLFSVAIIPSLLGCILVLGLPFYNSNYSPEWFAQVADGSYARDFDMLYKVAHWFALSVLIGGSVGTLISFVVLNLKTAVKVPKSTQPLGTPRKFQKSQPTNQVDSIF